MDKLFDYSMFIICVQSLRKHNCNCAHYYFPLFDTPFNVKKYDYNNLLLMEGEDKVNNYSQSQAQIIKFRGRYVPIAQIINKQVRAIRTNEEMKMNSVSAFELFKAVYENKVTAIHLKEMSTPQFEKFLKWIHPSHITQPNLQQQYQSFMKSLKLSVGSTIQFKLQPSQTSSALSDFCQFSKLFLQLSDITVVIKLGKWTQVQEWRASLQKLWQSLTTMKKIKIEIKGQWETINSFLASSIMRSLLFGGLACLTEISHLSFFKICFTSIGTNDYLSIQQSLCAVFQNNKITSLRFEYCNQFPIFRHGLELSAINVSDNINLNHLDLSLNQLSAINVGKNINLTQLNLSYNIISVIDVSNNINLTQLNLRYNKISAIDVSKNVNLTHLDLRSNQLSAIDVSHNINLTELWLGSNKISAIDISNCTKLTWLSFQGNSLESVLLSFSSLLQYTNFMHQRSAACEIQLLYNKEDSQQCNERAMEWTEVYRKGDFANQHGCNYVFMCFNNK